MRLLAVGFPLPDVSIDNYSVLTAPSYFDYDAIYVDPQGITTAVHELIDDGREFEAQDGRPVVNAPTSAKSVSAADQIRRRREETQRLLEAGGVVLVAGRPNATVGGLLGFEGCDRYQWLPAPAGVAWGSPQLRPAEGQTLRVLDEHHPVGAYVREFRKALSYRAMFDDRDGAMRAAGRAVVAGGSGGPVAMVFPVLGGTVVFLPVPSDDAGSIRSDIAAALVMMAKELATAPSLSNAPYWERSVAVPGLEQVEAELEEAETAAKTAVEHTENVRARQAELASSRRLLWDTGSGYAGAVREALVRLGFTVTSSAEEPLAIEDGEAKALVEFESSTGEVVEWPYVRLQRRLEDLMLKRSETPKGVVVANGFRETAPESRGLQYTEPLRVACENYRYALVTGETLFAMVQRVLGGATDEEREAFRRRILRTNGVLEKGVALGEAGEESATGPLF